jgi:hypothetical protein
MRSWPSAPCGHGSGRVITLDSQSKVAMGFSTYVLPGARVVFRQGVRTGRRRRRVTAGRRLLSEREEPQWVELSIDLRW